MFLEIKFTEKSLLLFLKPISMKTNSCIVEFKLSIWYSSSRSDSCIGREERDKRNRLPVVPYQIYFKGKKMKVIAPRRG